MALTARYTRTCADRGSGSFWKSVRPESYGSRYAPRRTEMRVWALQGGPSEGSGTLRDGTDANPALVVRSWDDSESAVKATNITRHESKVTAEDREKNMNQKGCVVWMTGLSGSGKSTLAYTLDHALTQLGRVSFVLDGDNIRHGLNKNLGFSAEDRTENIRRVGELSKLFCEANLITLVSFISPYEVDRQQARSLIGSERFIEVFMKVPLSVCEDRDPKGLYKLARAGKIKSFTGIDDPYEPPTNPEITMEVCEGGDLIPPEIMAKEVIQYLEERGFLQA